MTPCNVDGADAAVMSGWRYRAVVWSALLAAAAYLALAFWTGWHEIWASVAKIGVLGIGATLLFSLVNYLLRFARWQLYLTAMGHPTPWAASLEIYLAGFALTTTPAKAGEALRGVLLRRRGVPYPISFAAFFSERLSDLTAIVLLTLLGLMVAYPPALPLVAVGAALVIAAYLVTSSGTLLQHLQARVRGNTRAASLMRHLIDTLLHARQCQSPLLMLWSTALSVAAWAAEAWAFYLLLHWMNNDVALSFAAFSYALSMLAGALSFMPGGLGSAEVTMVALLTLQGVGQSDALVATLLCRLTTLWFAVAIGVVTMVRVSSRPTNGERVRLCE